MTSFLGSLIAKDAKCDSRSENAIAGMCSTWILIENLKMRNLNGS